jgi:hypothetical protein
MNPFDYKQRIIVAQNQSPIALGLTELASKGRIATMTKEDIKALYVEMHDFVMENFDKKFLKVDEVKKDE